MNAAKTSLLSVVDQIRTKQVVYLLIFLQFGILLLQDSIPGGDDAIRRGATIELANLQWPGMKYSVIFPAVVAPFYRVAELIDIGDLLLEKAVIMLWLIWSLTVTKTLLKYRNLRTVYLYQVAVIASMLTVYTLGFNAEAFSAFAVSGGLLLGLVADSNLIRLVGWLAVVFGVANIPAQLPALCIVSILFFIRDKSVKIFLLPAVAFIFIVAEATFHQRSFSFSKYGSNEVGNSPLLPWGEVVDFGQPFIFGLLGILFSFGRGLIVFIPLLFVAFVKPTDPIREWSLYLAVFCAAMIPIYAKWWAWYGGVTFGPRFFLIGSIAGAIGFAELLHSERSDQPHHLQKIILSFALCWSGWVALSGSWYFLRPRVFDICVRDGFLYEPLCWYSPEYSTLFSPIWDFKAPTFPQLLLGLAVLNGVLSVTIPVVRSNISAIVREIHNGYLRPKNQMSNGDVNQYPTAQSGLIDPTADHSLSFEEQKQSSSLNPGNV